MNANKRKQANAWLCMNVSGCERRLARELSRFRVRGRKSYIPKKAYKSPEWREQLGTLISAYAGAALAIREMPDHPAPLIRGTPPWGNEYDADARLRYIARLWSDPALSKEADIALTHLYHTLKAFQVTNGSG